MFQPAGPEVSPEAKAVLDRIAELMLAQPRIQVLRIEGHTCSAGQPSLNLKLSKARAESVRKYLLEKGVTAERVEAVGVGSERPVATNKTREGRELNRRVEIQVVAEAASGNNT